MTEEREIMEVDVLFVGGGISSLSGAYHLSNLIKKHNEKVEQTGEGKALDEVMIAVIEKGAYVGAHGISGAVMDPSAMKELIPDFLEKGAPVEGEVKKESVQLLTKKGKIKLPFNLIPGGLNPLDNHGKYVVSVSRLNEWLGGLVEEEGVNIFPGFAGVEILYEDHRVVGVRTDDKGIDSDGSRKSTFEPGIDLKAKVTVFGEGSRGSLTKTLIQKFNLDEGKNPMSYVVGVKEVWELPENRMEPGEVIHTMGYPHKPDTYGGGFIYGMKNNHVTVGLLTGLDYKDPCLDPHREFQKFKQHPSIAKLLKGGKMIQYGAKSAPVGGFFAVPKLTVDGAMIIGDAAGLFISMQLKGVHPAIKSGMLAAETIFEALLEGDFSKARLQKYRQALLESTVGNEIYKSRNFHQLFHKSLYRALIMAGVQIPLGGAIIKSRLEADPDYTSLNRVFKHYGKENPSDEDTGEIKFDGELTFDKETDVYYSGSTHEEKQPPHLKILNLDICYNQCAKEYHNPCLRFCPANVYEMEIDEETGKKTMKLNFSNCVHCKTCDIKDPYENIDWVPPEGGGGPKYTMV